MNRIDEIIVFHRLTGEDIRAIAGNMVQTVALRAAALGVHLTVTPEAVARLAEAGYDPDYGARPLRRTVQTQLEDPLAEALLTGELSSGGEAGGGRGRDRTRRGARQGRAHGVVSDVPGVVVR